jgi:hypothetical protein
LFVKYGLVTILTGVLYFLVDRMLAIRTRSITHGLVVLRRYFIVLPVTLENTSALGADKSLGSF